MTHRILLIDDSISFHCTSHKLLEQFGYKVTSSYNGEEALYLLESGYIPDLIVCELDVAPIDGREFIRIRQSLDKIRKTPLIVVTSGAHPKDLDAKIPFIPKPVPSDVFVSEIRKALAQPEAMGLQNYPHQNNG
jgi:CheY-like chemotaxis protein